MKKKIGIIILAAILVLWVASYRPTPATFSYGVSFSKLHADELGLDWRATYLAILDDLKVRKLRLTAHWDAIEREQGSYDWSVLDFQIREAEKRGAEVNLAIGRRVPGWPECHEPGWFHDLNATDKETRLLNFVKTGVERYKSSPAIKNWQIENEAFLTLYAVQHCDNFVDEKILQKEIALVRELDKNSGHNRKIVITDSGEIGLWYKAYRNADIFGTSLYLYVWNHTLGPIRYPIPPAFFRLKYNLVRLIYGTKPAFVSELSAEPWLLKPIIETPLETQLMQMNLERFKIAIQFAKKTGFAEQYLWGAEWWYYLKEKQNHPELWNYAREIFK